ncbi:MAG: EI24 domain-containing protein [Flavobacteriales bacterium]
MGFVRDAWSGADGFLKAFGFVRRNGMAWMFLVPVLLWVLLAYLGYSLLEGPVEAFNDRVAAYLDIPVEEGSTDPWSAIKAFFNDAREVIMAFVLKLAVGYLLFIANKYIVLVLLSPLLAYASERTEEILIGKRFPFNWGRLIRDALRGAGIALRNALLEITFTVVIWALTLLIPIITPISVVLLFFVSAYFYGFSTFDYVFERRRMRIGESVRAVNERIGAVVANGSLFNVLMKVPLLGVMFAPVLASVGAALAVLVKENEQLAVRNRRSEAE